MSKKANGQIAIVGFVFVAVCAVCGGCLSLFELGRVSGPARTLISNATPLATAPPSTPGPYRTPLPAATLAQTPMAPRIKSEPQDVPPQQLPKTSSSSKYIRGPLGGCYYINSSGNKTYVPRSLCD